MIAIITTERDGYIGVAGLISRPSLTQIKTPSIDRITAEVLEFVHRHKNERFFLYVPFTIPHFEPLVETDYVK